jgi:hypoxanthine phosphoribosyltransferase
MLDKRYLTWEDFDQAVERLGMIYFEAYRAKLRRARAWGIYGEPRGGLSLAVALSHLLNLPLLMSLPYRGKVIWVDDIFDSNQTYILASAKAKEYETELLPMAWFSRYEPPPEAYYVERMDNDIWLVFPWERWSDPDTEINRYQSKDRMVVP